MRPSPRSNRLTLVLVPAAVVILIVAGIGIGRRTTTSPNGRPFDDPGPATITPAQSANRKTYSGTQSRFFRIEERPLTKWGDYGNILQHGMTAHLGRVHGLLSLERTGPYMPPITFPGIGDVVLSSDGRKLLEASGLSGFGFQPVNKTRIVSLPWNEWDLTTGKPPEYPRSGEPEDYILERPPNAGVAEKMGDIWELVVPVTARIGRPHEIVRSFRELYVELDSWNGADIFRGKGFGGPLVTERAKVWFEEHFGAYTRFEEFAQK